MGNYKISLLIPILAILILGPMPTIYSDSSEEYYMLTLINSERQSQGLDPLTMNSALSTAARLHSQDMINRNFFNHVNPDGLTPSDRARNAGYNFIALAENICGNPSIDAGHSSLMGSPSHRTNILNPAYKEVGIGIVDGGPYGKMITQVFGTQVGNQVNPSNTESQAPQGKPDLTVQSIDLTGKAESLKPISIKIILNNSGKKNAGNFVFAIFEGPPEKGNLLGKVNISSLYAGQNITANFNWTLPSEGNYTLYLIVDYNNDVEEENENNNISTYPLTIKSTTAQDTSQEKVNNTTTPTTSNESDLYLSNRELSYPQNVYQGTSSLVSFRIRNIGKSTAFEIPVKVYVNGNLKSSSNINQLLSYSYIDMSLYLTFADPGEYNIEIRVDPDNIIEEISKSNNFVNFNLKVMQRENSPIITQNNTQAVKDIDLLIYPYYITIEEQENEFLTIKAKIKNKSNVRVDNFSVTFYEKDYNNSSNNKFIEKIYLSLDPEEIVEESITFIPTKNSGEVIVSIDEENKINETNENNNIAIKEFSRTKNQDMLDFERNLVTNTTLEDVNTSKVITISMKIKDINASNVYLYYKYDESNSSFFILKMNNEGNNSYSTEIDPSGRNKLFYYFEVDTGDEIIKSPPESPNVLYSVDINYQKNIQEKSNPGFLDNIRKLFGLG